MAGMASATSDTIVLDVPSCQASVRMRLFPDTNPALCAAILKLLPLESVFGHVVISGDGMWLPSRLIYLDPPVMVQRQIGSVYLNAPGQTICFTYGAITESAVVNEFARVIEEDLPQLRTIGLTVWQETVVNPRRTKIVGTLRKSEG